MTNDDQINEALVGGVGVGVSPALVLGLNSMTAWPVDAFSVDLKDVENQSVAWLQGNSVGLITATGSFENPTLSAVVRHIGSIRQVEVTLDYVDNGPRPHVDRSMSIEFEAGEPIRVDVGRFVAEHYRDCANEFVSEILRCLAKS